MPSSVSAKAWLPTLRARCAAVASCSCAAMTSSRSPVRSALRMPFKADSAMGIIYQHAQAPVPLLRPRFARYQSLLNMMLAKLPDDRLQSASEIEEWL